MENIVGALEQRVAGLVVADVGRFKHDVRIVLVLGEVGFAAADQIVDHADDVAAFDQEVDHVAADEAGAAGDHGDLTPGRSFRSDLLHRADVVIPVVVKAVGRK